MENENCKATQKQKEQCECDKLTCTGCYYNTVERETENKN